MLAIDTWLAAHPVVRGALWMLLVAVVGAFVNWVTYKRTDYEWAIYQREHPRLAFVIRVCRAIFPHLRKIPALAAFFPPPAISKEDAAEKAAGKDGSA